MGGRLTAASLEGIEFEPCQPAVPSRAPQLFGLIGELGLSAAIRRQPLSRMSELRSGRSRLLELRLPDRRPPWGALRSRRLRRLLRWYAGALDTRVSELAARLDDRSVADFSRLYLGPRRDPELFRPLLEACFGLDSAETSRVLLLQLLDTWGAPELQQVSGLARIPEALAARLDDVRTGERVLAVQPDARGLSLASGATLTADGVVLATPASAVAALVPTLSPAEQSFFEREPAYAARLQLALAIRGESPAAGAWLAETHAEFPPLSSVTRVACPPGRDAANDASLLILSARSGFARAHWGDSDDSIAARLLECAARLDPGLRARTTAQALYRLREATPRFDVYRYRGIERLRREQRAQCGARPVFFCGDYLVAPHPEGAVSSGVRAADDALAALASA